MPFTFAIAATFAMQFLGAAVMALILSGFHRQYRKSYLQHWMLGWTALAIFHLSSAASMVLFSVRHLPASDPQRIAVTFVNAIAGYTQIGWFMFGVYEIVRRRHVRISHARRILAALTITGVIASLLFISGPPMLIGRYFARVSLLSLTAATAYGAAAVALWRSRSRRLGIGFTVLAAAFFFCALEELHYIGIGFVWLAKGVLTDYYTSLGYVDFLLQSVLAVGMIASLLEDEREAAELASAEIEHLAYHDALTGLPNRPLFIDRLIVSLAQTARTPQKLAVFFLDLDRFKDINDSLGHSTGDQLLKAVADRVRRCVREGDTVARFGGDEFTLLVPRIENIEDAAKIAQKIIETLKIPFDIHDRELFVTTSIGISLFPTDGIDAETLVRNADSAMYRAKESGRDNYQLYAPAMNARALERLALENMLRKALDHRELVLFYQPLIDAESKLIIGVEALIRWSHPELGLLSPAHFISVAELSGLIIPIGRWVLHTACRQLKTWQKKIDRSLTVSVNLSARQFAQPDLVDQIRGVLADTALEPQFLELEITESNAMQNAENTIHTLRELKQLGVRIAMDDFGTGYSSLNYLKRFPIDTLKLDQMFVQDVNTDAADAAIVSAVITMAQSLRLAVVAEGVETEEQLAFLRREGCDRIQGYLFSAPMSAEELEPYLIENAQYGSHRAGIAAFDAKR
jgi:diguanylate cyclase (GGDEF)-like protein